MNQSVTACLRKPAPTCSAWALFLALLLLACRGVRAVPTEKQAAYDYKRNVAPILTKYCGDCHTDGEEKGGVAFDKFKNDHDLLDNHDLWLNTLLYVRSGMMPPHTKKQRPNPAEIKKLASWIKFEAFQLDPINPDPGRITLRRLNRVEYKNTIKDLMDIDYDTNEEFPPDDTGYGFDNIGDVLTLSPLLLEKYMQAAETIVARAVPTVPRKKRELEIRGKEFHDVSSSESRERMTFYKEATSAAKFKIAESGDYHVVFDVEVAGQFDFDPGRSKVDFSLDGTNEKQEEFAWHDHLRYSFAFDKKWEPGEHEASLTLHPLTPKEKKVNSLDMRIIALRVEGPQDPAKWVQSKNYDRFFSRPDPPKGVEEKRKYAQEILTRFVRLAYRRPVDSRTISRLVGLAETGWNEPGKRFEDGIAHAMVAVLASPRFLFRVEGIETASAKKAYPFLDEYSLASRLSYFIWSTMPDAELSRLADRGELRHNLNAEVQRMLKDPRSAAFVKNFTGQWLQLRDVASIPINDRVILRHEDKTIKISPIDELRPAMREETEMKFDYIVRQDRSVNELISANYTFLNERLAKVYGITNVSGNEMRRVDLPPGSPRGGILTDASILMVTSNPTRTSPVKRGLFVLDNILGTPAPPPPANVPNLEDSGKAFKDKEPTLRDMLELHRSHPLCASCHQRMDPLGLALENFNALGCWRDSENKQPINPSGQLMTGESFTNIVQLKEIILARHSEDFYRCLTQKLLTYALGRGLEYYDSQSVDVIVDRMVKSGGKFSTLFTGVIESTAFQERRKTSSVTPEPVRQSKKEDAESSL